MGLPANQPLKQPVSLQDRSALTPISVQHSLSKRIFDIVFSFLALFGSLPFILLMICLIKCSTRGPVFYKSVRLGRGGKVIYCWKFRSMYPDADERLLTLLESDLAVKEEWDEFQKLKNDPRITPIGRFLRKTSLDEWPQFWNVLKGDLSVVGPRPPTLVGPPERFSEEIYKWYGPSTYKILSVRPGLTGMWQISGRNELSFEERVQMDQEYAETRTFFKDLFIIAKTIPVLIFPKGAY